MTVMLGSRPKNSRVSRGCLAPFRSALPSALWAPDRAVFQSISALAAPQNKRDAATSTENKDFIVLPHEDGGTPLRGSSAVL